MLSDHDLATLFVMVYSIVATLVTFIVVWPSFRSPPTLARTERTLIRFPTCLEVASAKESALFPRLQNARQGLCRYYAAEVDGLKFVVELRYVNEDGRRAIATRILVDLRGQLSETYDFRLSCTDAWRVVHMPDQALIQGDASVAVLFGCMGLRSILRPGHQVTLSDAILIVSSIGLPERGSLGERVEEVASHLRWLLGARRADGALDIQQLIEDAPLERLDDWVLAGFAETLIERFGVTPSESKFLQAAAKSKAPLVSLMLADHFPERRCDRLLAIYDAYGAPAAVRAQALTRLAPRLPRHLAVSLLRSAMVDVPEEVAIESIRLIGKLKLREFIGDIATLHTGIAKMDVAITEALVKIQPSNLEEILLTRLRRSPWAESNTTIVDALGQYGTITSLRTIDRYLSSSNTPPSLHLSAAQAAKGIRGRIAGPEKAGSLSLAATATQGEVSLTTSASGALSVKSL
ncbi:MAG: hypothetical protein H6729_04815 [Deltaproteobacteria bacterium]|nr:hypothetical protein [Deltaproteobacteria bacterium]